MKRILKIDRQSAKLISSLSMEEFLSDLDIASSWKFAESILFWSIYKTVDFIYVYVDLPRQRLDGVKKLTKSEKYENNQVH